MSHAYQESVEERARVDAALAKMGVSRSTKPRADVVDLNTGQPRRQPLGLRPVNDPENDGDDDYDYIGPKATAEKIVASSLAALPPEAWTARDLWEYGLCTSLEMHFEGGDDLRKRTRELRSEIGELKSAQRLEVAELKTVVAELKGEVSALRSVQETLRISSRGERGEPGPRGIAGAQGPTGPTGPQGPQGEAGAVIVSWEARPERFELTPILGNGLRGVSAHLLPFFEQYDSAVRDDEDDA
jgi:hypothetical protein